MKTDERVKMKKIISAIIFISSINAFAITKTAELGIRLNHAIAEGVKSNDVLGFQAGIIVSLPSSDLVAFRTGAVLVMKDTEVEALGVKLESKKLFLDVPITWEFGNDAIKGYAGVNLSLKISSSCDISVGTCTMRDEKPVLFQPTAGLDVAITNEWRAGAFYEHDTEYSANYEQSSYGLKAGYTF